MSGITNADSPAVKEAIRLLVQANRILANEGIVDAYGHVSMRHPEVPDHCLMSRARAPELVEPSDIMEFGPDGEEVSGTGFGPYLERYIHTAVYESRPEINAVCHNHAIWFLPYTISKTMVLRPVIHTGAVVDGPLPVWNIAEEFGDDTDLMVTNIDHGRSMARTMGDGAGVLLRAHGSTIVGVNIRWAVGRCIELYKNAQVQLQAEAHGEITELSQGEIARTMELTAQHNYGRAWEFWCRRAGLSVDAEG